eukprot:PITA_20613
MASTEMAMGRGVSRHGCNFMVVITKLIVLLSVSRELLMCEAQGVAAAGNIQRSQIHQVLAALSTSSVNSGQTNAAIGGLGTDFCYIDVINTAAQQSVWESPCETIPTTNPCILQLSDNGLEIMDGNNRDVWNNGASNNYQSLVLLENGALQLLHKKGQIIWSSTDHPRVNQNCGTVLQPGSSPFINPPFASPLQAQLPNGQPAFAQPFTTANPIVGSGAPQIIYPYYLVAAGCLVAIFFLP